jgi:hypothetical protein
MDFNIVTFEITPSATSVDEGSTVFFNVTARSTGPLPWLLNYLPYEISGVSAEDISRYKQSGLIGNFLLNPTTGTGAIAIGIVNDFIAEGPEVLTVIFKETNTGPSSFVGNFSLKAASASITINDTSNSPAPTYSLRSLDSGSVREGSSANFLLTTTGLAEGTAVTYSLSGISSSDIFGGLQSRTVKINASGEALISVPILADNLTEGNEILTVASMGESATAILYDTSNSKGPAAADLVYVFKSEKTGPNVNPASYSYYYTTKPEEAAYINSQANWPWVQKASTFEAAHSNPELSTPVYRFWSDKLQAPYFTINTAERDQIIAWSSTGKNGYDWQYFPGTGFNVYTSSAPTDDFGRSAIPVYCAWMDDTDFNPANGITGGLLFTADKSEYDGLVELVGVTGAGIVFYGEVPGN